MDAIARTVEGKRMNDRKVIYLDDALDALRNEFKKAPTTAIRAMEVLRALPPAQPEQQWIPCSERLPETRKAGNSFSGFFMKSHPVLVYGVAEGEEIAEFHVASYCDDLNGYTYWSTELDAVTITGVKAWMPLPEPYAERRKE